MKKKTFNFSYTIHESIKIYFQVGMLKKKKRGFKDGKNRNKPLFVENSEFDVHIHISHIWCDPHTHSHIYAWSKNLCVEIDPDELLYLFTKKSPVWKDYTKENRNDIKAYQISFIWCFVELFLSIV